MRHGRWHRGHLQTPPRPTPAPRPQGTGELRRTPETEEEGKRRTRTTQTRTPPANPDRHGHAAATAHAPSSTPNNPHRQRQAHTDLEALSGRHEVGGERSAAEGVGGEGKAGGRRRPRGVRGRGQPPPPSSAPRWPRGGRASNGERDDGPPGWRDKTRGGGRWQRHGVGGGGERSQGSGARDGEGETRDQHTPHTPSPPPAAHRPPQHLFPPPHTHTTHATRLSASPLLASPPGRTPVALHRQRAARPRSPPSTRRRGGRVRTPRRTQPGPRHRTLLATIPGDSPSHPRHRPPEEGGGTLPSLGSPSPPGTESGRARPAGQARSR